MCGILGFCDFHSARFSNLTTTGIKDRGPDNIGKFENNNVGLYHSRLAIIDNKESSNQPIINQNYYLICNGEIYNHKDLKRELQEFNFTTNSDCETIIAVYHTFGIGGFSKLDGMYSFALYDENSNKLIIHKDSVGKKPLFFFYRENDYFIFASNITAIKENIVDDLTINKNQIIYYINNKHLNPQYSLYNEIKPVMPGEVIEIDIHAQRMEINKIDEKFHFNIDFTNNKLIKKELFKLIKKSIHKRLNGVKTPVILFSGGIDSTIIAYEALKYNNNTKLLSLKQPFSFMNDEPFVKEFAKKMSVKVNFINIMNMNFSENIDKFINKLDQPFGVVAYYYLSQLSLQAKSFDNVLFTGDGADEIFFGYKKYEEWVDLENGTKETLINLPLLIKYNSYGFSQANEELLGHGFIKVDKSTAENQMEARCPFLDKELISFVRQIPSGFWKNKDIKFILKEYLIDNDFDEKYVYRKKLGFAFPFRYIMIFKYKSIMNFIEKNKILLKSFNVEIEQLTYKKLYKKFDYYFNIYVLLKFLVKEQNV